MPAQPSGFSAAASRRPIQLRFESVDRLID